SFDRNNDPWPTTLLYNDQIKWLVGLISQLATETDDAELVRKIVVSDLVLQAQLVNDRHVGLLVYALESGAVTEMINTRFETYLGDARPLNARIGMLVDESALDAFETLIANDRFEQINEVTKSVFDEGAIANGQNRSYDPELPKRVEANTGEYTQGVREFRDFILADIEAYTGERISAATWQTIRSIAIVLIATLACGLGGWYIASRIQRSISAAAADLERDSTKGQQLSKWVSLSSAGLASGCSEQAASIEEVHSTMEQVKAMANDSFQRVEGVLAIADKSDASARASADSMRRMREAMGKIQGSS